MTRRPEDIKVIIATDCGSTTTKAILFEKVGDEYRQTYRGEAPTTVEAPFEDVTRGVLNAIQEVEELSGRPMLDEDGKFIKPARMEDGRPVGVDIYISTSSAGGGLQMLVSGVVRKMTAESAERASLSAGAIVMDTISVNDKRMPHEQIERIRQLRPDMILLAGLTDDSQRIDHVVSLAELIRAANPRPRLGQSYNLPVIYSGTQNAREEITEILGEKTDLTITENLRPSLERENLDPARDAIHDLFMEHVMQQAPGYKKLMSWTDTPIVPTPGAVGTIIERISQIESVNVVGVDIGGATTDVFSVFPIVENGKKRPKFNRTVSANLGMSYSIANVLASAGLDKIMRWVPFDTDERALRNAIKNKMIRPTTVPQTLQDLVIEQAVAKEALRLAFLQHKEFATSLKGVQTARTISDAFDQSEGGLTIVNMMALNLLVGSGGVLSHAPRRVQTAMMLLDAFLPEGITMLAVDSIFMMPHLGVLSELHPQAAAEIFEKDCMIHLGDSIAPRGRGKPGKPAMKITLDLPDGQIKETLSFGDLRLVPLGDGEQARLVAEPIRGVDVGAGAGKPLETTVHGGVVGLLFDLRGRPLELPENDAKRQSLLTGWFSSLELYPPEFLGKGGE